MSTALPLRGFWMAGFESACHINRAGCRLDLASATRHRAQADEDYRLITSEGLTVSRESIPWNQVDRDGRYDFSVIEPLITAAGRHQVQVLWTLCHWGWPDGLDPLSEAFVDRMAWYAGAAARFIGARTERPHWFNPVNEISFAAWASGDVAYMHPFLRGASDAVKQQLVRATIGAIDAIWRELPDARIFHTDPLIQVAPPRHRPDLEAEAAAYTESQFAAWDMLAGRMAPELGGHPRYLDVLAANFYAPNQWEIQGDALRWDGKPLDDRWVPLSAQLERLHRRYGRPILVGETSHFGAGRAAWIREVTDEVLAALDRGIDLQGVCLYPVIDRPDWEAADHWHRSGVWDLVPDAGGDLRRIPCRPYIEELRRSRRRLHARSYPPTPARLDAVGS